MRSILLLGDSLTEQGYQNQWVSRLHDYYRRKLDVVCRGLSGYNTRWVRSILSDPEGRERLIPKHLIGETSFVTIFFGANDAALPGNPQHVPLSEYEENLSWIIRFVQAEVQPSCGVFVITPPPVDEVRYLQFCKSCRDPATVASNRTLETTRTYRDAAIRVAASLPRCFAVDLYDAFLTAEAAQGSERAWSAAFFPEDGLHFNALGGAVVFDTLFKAIQRSCGENIFEQSTALNASAMAMDIPHWSEQPTVR